MKVGQHVSFMSVEEAWVTNKHNRWTTPAEVTCFCLRHVLMLLRWCRVYGSCVVFNKKLMDFCVPKTMTRTFLNQKLWVDKSICTALRTNTTACNKKLSISNMRKYKAASDKVHRVQSVSRRARITDCEEKPSSSLAGEAQIFYVYCEGRKPTYHLVGSWRPLGQITTEGGLDSLGGREFIRRFLKGRANEHCDIFNDCIIPTCIKQSDVVPKKVQPAV